MTAVLVITAIALPVWVTSWTRHRVERAVRDRVLEGQLAAAASVDQQSALAFDFAVRTAVTAADRPGLVDAVIRRDASRATEILANIAELAKFAGIAVYDGAGAVLARHGDIGAAATDSPAAPAIAGPFVRDGRVITMVTARMAAHDATVGALRAEFEFASLIPDDSALRYGRSGTVSIVDRNAVILASGNKPSVGLPLLAPEAVRQARRGTEAVSSYYAPRLGYRVISAYVPARRHPWGAVVVAPQAETFAPVTRIEQQLEIGGLVFAAVSLAVAAVVGTGYLRHERRLRAAQVELVRANEDLETFAGVAAHDLKNPLTAIRGYGEMIASDPDLPPAAAEHGAVIVRRARAMADLVDELLTFAHSANAAPTRDTIVVSDLLAEVRAALASLIDERGAVVRGPEGTVAVSGDRTQLMQVLQNLVANAILHGPTDRQPEVAVSAAEADGFTEIVVEDNGAGIPEAERERVFRPFERAGREDRPQGTGLGLAIVKRVVDGHGGDIQIRDGAMGGAAIVVRLPR